MTRSALDTADHFLRCIDRKAGDTISALKLQKLVYYAQAWSLVFRDEPLFYEDIQAWVHGPAVPEVWHRYKEYGYTAIPESPSPALKFSESELEVLQEVWLVYGDLSAKQLEELTHSEAPWRNARQGLNPSEYSNNIISHIDMKDYYSAFAEEY